MVSLFDMCLQRPTWAHLSTGITTLDQMVDVLSDGLFDFQTVPANPGMPAVMCNLMVSHLRKSELLTVVVIESLNPFQWDLLKQHPQYDPQWDQRNQIKVYTLLSVVEFFWFFTFGPARSLGVESTMLFILNFHEIVDLYKLHISAAYEEALLRHQIDKNRVLLANLDKIELEGIELVSLPQLPPQSDLLRQSPYIKAQNHIDELFKEMAEFTYKQSAVVVLVGSLDPKYRPVKRNIVSPSPNSSFAGTQNSFPLSQASGREKNELILDPVTFSPPTRNGEPGLNESRITARLVFYNDWYHKSPLFLSKGRSPTEAERFHVLVVKVTSLNGAGNINDPVFFNLGAHHRVDDELDLDLDAWLVDLQTQESGDLSALIQNSINSTQPAPRAVSTQINVIPSSPPVTILSTEAEVPNEDLESDEDRESPDENSESSDDEGNVAISPGQPESPNENGGEESQELYVEGSDVELTGTLLEDLESDNWNAKYY